MSVKVAFQVADRSAEHFKTAVFRFMELTTASDDKGLVIRTASDPTRQWVHAELEFSTPAMADQFNQYLTRMRLDFSPMT